MVAEHYELRGFRDGPSFRKAIGFSVVLHLLLFGAALFLVPSNPRRLFYSPAYTVSLVGPGALREEKPASRVEATKKSVARPEAKAVRPVKKVKERRPRPQPKAKPKVIPLEKVASAKESKKVPPEAPAREVNKAPEPSSRVAAAVERIRQKLAKEAPVGGTPSAPGSGGPSGGGSAGLTDIIFREYYNLIWERVSDAWVLPQNIEEGERKRLVAIVEFQVARTGEISKVRLESSSGNTYFDNSALRAVQKVNPLPSFPPELTRPYLMVGVRFHNPND